MDTTRLSLLLRIRDGQNHSAWHEFDSIYRPMLLRFAKTRGLDELESDDLVQQCMMTIHQRINSFEYDPDKGRFKAWLRTLVNNRVSDLFRRRRETVCDTTDGERLKIGEPSPEDIFDRLWMEEHLRHCLTNLRTEVDPTTYDAFRRYVIDEEPPTAVCAALAMNPDQLYRVKWRMTQRLREMMQDLLGEDA